MATAYKNLESSFDYMKRLQDAVNSKASSASITHLEALVKRLSKELTVVTDQVSGRWSQTR